MTLVHADDLRLVGRRRRSTALTGSGMGRRCNSLAAQAVRPALAPVNCPRCMALGAAPGDPAVIETPA